MKKILSFILIVLCAFATANAQVPGQDPDNALLLTEGVQTSFTSFNNGKNVLYAKFVAEDEGTVTIDLPVPTTYSRWMEEGVMAYGQMRQNYFRSGNQFDVQIGHTYYLYYTFAGETTSNISYTLTRAAEGSTRNKSILISTDGTVDLLGTPHVDDIKYNTVTWFRLDRAALSNFQLMTISLSGDNLGDVSLYRNEETTPVKSYIIGEGSGMVPVNATVDFDINLTSDEYYVAITQDDVNGQARFSFSAAQPGQTMGTAIEAHKGDNTVLTEGWYFYVHEGDAAVVSVVGVGAVYNAQGRLISSAEDAVVGFAMEDGQKVYFKATSLGFSISERQFEKGETASNPIIMTLDKDGVGTVTFSLNGSASDVRRYMLFTATADGTFMYGTENSRVIDMALGSNVRDVDASGTSRPVSIIQKYESDYGMFIYKWEVEEGHTYLIEQTLVNNLGNVLFYASFTEVQEGESRNKAIPLTLNVPYDLGRKENLARFYKFTAPESGDYLLSVNVNGQVRVYGEEEYNVSKDYANGTDFHNDVISLEAGQQFVFSVAPSIGIEHISSSVQDFFIPDYYVLITRSGEAGSELPCAVELSADTYVNTAESNTWYGPVLVPAGQTLRVVADVENAGTDCAAVLLTNEKGQWFDQVSQISSMVNGTRHTYILTSANTDRTVYLLSNGVTAPSTWCYTFADPAVGIDSVSLYSQQQLYTLQGFKTRSPRKGITIVVDRNGTKKEIR